MGLNRMFNWASGFGKKAWRGAKKAVSDVYHPISKVVRSVKSAERFVDNLLDKAVDLGIPSSMVAMVRDNPIYEALHGAIDFADDLVNKDLPKYGGMIGNLGDRIVEGNITGNDALREAQNISNDLQGYTKNTMASARLAMRGV